MYNHPRKILAGKILIKAKCILCETEVDYNLTLKEFYDLKTMPIQQALPDLSPDDRELLISGICGTCFDKQFCDRPNHDHYSNDLES